jgi:GTP-binding protein Era
MGAEASTFRAGYVAIVGEPNVGKSTLLNALLNQKISIVTRKPQTTRQRVLGIYTDDRMQIVFLDTPGLLQPKYLLHEKMIKSAYSAMNDADILLMMTEVGRGITLPELLDRAVNEWKGKKPMFLVINKVDTVHRDEVLPIIAHFAQTKQFDEIIPVSALKSENLQELLSTLQTSLPEHPPLYPPDIVSEQPERFFVAELIREKIFERFHEEIPYSTAVDVIEFKEREAGKVFMHAEIVVERESQKGIVIGSKGSALKAVGQAAREEIERFLDRPVFLDLHVKVREGWRENESWLKRLGYGP